MHKGGETGQQGCGLNNTLLLANLLANVWSFNPKYTTCTAIKSTADDIIANSLDNLQK